MSAPVTITGNVGHDPELRFTQSGKATASFSVVTERRAKEGEEWVSKDVTWWRVECWDQMAENVAESITKGTRVIVTGKAFIDKWQDKDGNERQTLKLRADDIGPSLKRAQAQIRKIVRENSEQTPTGRAPMDDPWATPAPADEAPF